MKRGDEEMRQGEGETDDTKGNENRRKGEGLSEDEGRQDKE